MANPRTPPPAVEKHDAPAAPSTTPAPTIDIVEVRLLGLTYQREVDGQRVIHHRGEVMHLPRAEYEATCVTRDGVRWPSSIFSLISDEKAAAEAKVTERREVDDRFMNARAANIAAMEASERARARARVEEARQAEALAKALEPLDRPGAIRHG